MRYVIPLFICFVSACTTIQTDMKAMGYSESDIELIKPYFQEYSSQLIEITPFVGSKVNTTAENNLKNIFCNCFKKHGELCRKPSAELGNQDKTLWAKSNGAELALKKTAAGGITRTLSKVGHLDPDSCPH